MAGTAVIPEAPSRDSASHGLERLFWDNHQGVFQAAYRITGSAADAEDVLQTVFLKLLARGVDDLAPSPRAYLRRAAVNAALDTVRARGVRAAVPLELVGPGGLAASSGDPERAHRARELRRRLRDAVARLHPRTAEIFVLKHFEGMTNPEIARVLGTSASVVAVVLFRARRLVRRSLENERKLGS